MPSVRSLVVAFPRSVEAVALQMHVWRLVQKQMRIPGENYAATLDGAAKNWASQVLSVYGVVFGAARAVGFALFVTSQQERKYNNI